MKKMTRGQATLLMLFIGLIYFGFAVAVANDNWVGDVKDNPTWGHIMLNAFNFGMVLVMAITFIQELVTWGDENDGWMSFMYSRPYRDYENEDNKTPFNFKKLLYWIIALIVLSYTYGIIKTGVKDCSKVYNTHKGYLNSYTQKGQEKVGFYDKLWKTYLQKEKITNVNKETFIQVTKIIMENRKDGEQIMWKFISENQQIPYEEFTKFYADLSDFICKQREGYFNIEKECQAIANRNNTLLDTFPNNMYNKILGCQRINFEYGFTSDSTDNVFKSKKENLK